MKTEKFQDFSEDKPLYRMRNPDLTPLNGLDVGHKAHNSGYMLRLFGLGLWHIWLRQTSYNPGTLCVIFWRLNERIRNTEVI